MVSKYLFFLWIKMINHSILGDDLQLLHLAILRLSDPMNVIVFKALFFGMESNHPNFWEQWAHHRAPKQCWITWASSWGFRLLTTENVRGWKGWLYGCVWKWGMHPKLGLKPLDLRSAYSHSNPCLKKEASRGLQQSSKIVKFGTESAECAVPLLRCVWSQPKPSTRWKLTCDFLVVVLTNKGCLERPQSCRSNPIGVGLNPRNLNDFDSALLQNCLQGKHVLQRLSATKLLSTT